MRQLLMSSFGLRLRRVRDWLATSRSVPAVSVFGRAMRSRSILLIGRSLLVLTGFVTFFQTLPDPIGRRAPRACLMQGPHIFIHRASLLRTILAMSPQASDAATNLADHDGNANGNGKEHQGETLANVP
ncbi:hypothetical protein BCh11DRAFT_01551 [Burkholderia sp. Ch1-1]|nr:hypothetical protein BCh11DRAFT_01551 [Burkholderia sp. Ch1-1]